MNVLTCNTIATEYILTIIPNEPVLGNLQILKKEIGKYIIEEKDLPPHIKIFPKFKWCEKEEYLLVHELKGLIPQINCFEVDILQINKNKELNQLFLQTNCKVDFKDLTQIVLNQLAKLVKNNEADIDELDGRIIMAEENFDPENFALVTKRLSKKIYSGIFVADKISLFKNLGNGWELAAEFHLN